MPLVRFEIRNEYGLGAEELYKEADNEEPKAVLDGVAVAGLVGILRQLGDLAEFAAEVFHGLQEQMVTTASRSHKILIRVQNIEAALPPLEKAVQSQKSHIHFAYTAGCEWHPKIRVKQKHLVHSDLPSSIMDSYEECHEPPRLHLLDKFDTGGPGACLRRYSDPSFFRKVISRSEPMNAEKLQREKRVRKSKARKKSSRWRNGELPHVTSISQRSGRVQFGSPNSYGQSSTTETVSTINMRSTTETISSVNMRPRSEHGDRYMTFDSRTRPGYIECVFEGSSSMQEEDKEHTRLPSATLKVHDCGSTDYILRDEQKEDAYDIITPGSLQDLNSASVTWDEKTEILVPKNQEPPHTVGDEGVASEFLQESSDLAKDFYETAKHRSIYPEGNVCDSADIQESLSDYDEFDEAGSEPEAAKLKNTNPEDIKCDRADIQESLSGFDESDEAGSEPDKYADALNTLESEAETDSECQTKQEVEKPLPMLSNEECDANETQLVIQNSDNSSAGFATTPYISSNKQMEPNDSDLVSSEDVIYIQPPETTHIPSDPNISLDIGLSTVILDGSRIDDSESSVGKPSSSLSSVPNLQPPVFDEIISPLYVSQGLNGDVSDTSSVNVWTNGGLLGLEPSKPPEHSMLNGEHRDSMAFVEDNAYGISLNNVLSDSHPNGLTKKVNPLVKTPEQRGKSPESQLGRERLPNTVNPNALHSDQLITRTTNLLQVADSECSASYHDKKSDAIVQEDSPRHSFTVSEGGLEISKDSCQRHSLGNAHRHDSKPTRPMESQGEVPVIAGVKCPSSESSHKNIESSLSMFGLGQRFHTNEFERKESTVHDDSSGPLGRMEAGITRLNEPHCIHQIGKSKDVHRVLPKQKPKNWLENGSPISSNPSSPPLEHMKISFHPLDAFETSKLRLKFPGGHRFHESIKDVIFPSFQLVPGPAILQEDVDSESDNDTFCRSSTYSEELISQYSESSSEHWESDDSPDSNDHEIYDALRKVSSVESISSDFELEGVSSGSIHDSNLKSSEPDNGIKKLHYNALFDLPSFDTVRSLASQQEKKCGSPEKDHHYSELQYPEEPVPPPPPLPPVEWRGTKPHSGVSEIEETDASKVGKHPNDLLLMEANPQTSKPDPPKQPQSDDIANWFLRSKQDQKVRGSKQTRQAESRKDMDEREDLLNQIRSKSFNLRRTVPTRPTLPEGPTTHKKVAAILEKANAIRQACAGSDEGGDETWSE